LTVINYKILSVETEPTTPTRTISFLSLQLEFLAVFLSVSFIYSCILVCDAYD